MKKTIINGKLVLEDKIVEKNLVYGHGEIIAISDDLDMEAEVIDAKGCYVLPGFVDIHCHAGGGFWAHENPVGMAQEHLKHGTTTILPTIAYTVSQEETLCGIDRILEAAKHPLGQTIAGINMEGPYINSKYGMASWATRKIDFDEYEQIIGHAKGQIRLWTIAPELDGALSLIDRLHKENIVVAAGHSEAGGELIMQLSGHGIQLATHMLDATGCSPTICTGTREFGIDEAVMLSDDIYAEIIADSLGMHVRARMLQLLRKIKGDDRLILITDMTEFSNITAANDSDLFFNEFGQLAGSRLTMDASVRNMKKHTNADFISLSKMASTNPAKLLGLDDEIGSIKIGKKANMIIIDDNVQIKKVFLNGKQITQV